MRPIPLARVRLFGAVGQNICGVSATAFSAKGSAAAGDQLTGVVDRITLLDNTVLFERDGKRDELVPLNAIATMVPVEDLKGELLGAEHMSARRAEAEKAAKELAKSKRPVEPSVPVRTDPVIPTGPVLRDDDGDILRPEAAIGPRVPTPAAEEPTDPGDEPVIAKKKPGRPRKGPME